MAVGRDVRGRLGGVPFTDETVLEYDPVSASWETSFDAAARHAGWGPADLVALGAGTDSDEDSLADRVETDTRVFVDAEDTGSDPLDLDTDDDGFADGVEVGAAADPNDPFSFPGALVPLLPGAGLVVLGLLLLAFGAPPSRDARGSQPSANG